MRYAVGAVLALVAALVGAYGLLILLASGAEFRFIGIVFLLLALPFAIAAWWVFARTAHILGWSILGSVAFWLAFASVTLGPSLFGITVPFVAAGGALACLALGAAVAAGWDWRTARATRSRPSR